MGICARPPRDSQVLNPPMSSFTKAVLLITMMIGCACESDPPELETEGSPDSQSPQPTIPKPSFSRRFCAPLTALSGGSCAAFMFYGIREFPRNRALGSSFLVLGTVLSFVFLHFAIALRRAELTVKPSPHSKK